MVPYDMLKQYTHTSVDLPLSAKSYVILKILGKLHVYTVELQWLKYLWNHENMFETGGDGAYEC